MSECVKLPHHEQQELCYNRPLYRQGRKFTAVKVYTINDESTHLLIFDVPGINVKDELGRLVKKFGPIHSLFQVKDYDDLKQFTELYHVNYKKIQSARFAKRQLDNRSFFGGVLHVCYAPEYESVAETKEKLMQRRREVSFRIRINEGKSMSGELKKRLPKRIRKIPALPLTSDRLSDFECSTMRSNVHASLTPSDALLQETSHTRVHKRKYEYVMGNERLQEKYNTNAETISCVRIPSTVDRGLTSNEMKTLKFLPRAVSSCVKRIKFHRNNDQVLAKTND